MKKIPIFSIILLLSGITIAQDMAAHTERTHITTTPSDTTKSSIEELSQVDESVLEKNAKKRKADQLHEDLGYMKSVDLYQEIQADKQVVTLSMMENLAHSYRLNGDTKAAEYWYDRLILETSDPENYLYHAQMLQSNGKCRDAVRWFSKYQQAVGNTANRDFIADCAEAESLKTGFSAKVSNATELNSSHLDFSPIVYEDGLVFTSSRGTNSLIVHRDNWTKKDFNDLFFAKKYGENSYMTPEPLSGNINGKHHDGTATFSPDGATMIFTRNNRRGKAADGVKMLKLYAAKKNGNSWTNVRELPFNSDEWASCHPTLSADGKLLYFSSDRPNSLGGMDIYVSKNVDGTWQEPINLGPKVNSAGNELFPFVDQMDKLYFASDGHKGLGGLDIFSVEKSNSEDEQSWDARKNMGEPINSAKDDFALVVNDDNKTGWLTSNRPGGLGGDDIYFWEATEPPKEKGNKRLICVTDKITGERLPNAIVNVLKTPYTANFESSYQTNEEGVFSLEINLGENYGLTVNKQGYVEKDVAISARELSAMEGYCIDLSKPKGINLKGKVIIAPYNSLLPDADLELINKCTGESIALKSNSTGTFDHFLDCDCDYELKASREDFKPASTSFSTKGFICEGGEDIEKVLKLDLETKPKPKLEDDIKEGDIIRLDNIYYDYNKYYIRSEAAIELDNVVNLMHRYPNMTIELRSHTDARGTKEYNRDLSAKRAQSAVEYIVSRGISQSRLSFRGFGEDELTNECQDGVRCNEYQHQENRRTEIKIVRLE